MSEPKETKDPKVMLVLTYPVKKEIKERRELKVQMVHSDQLEHRDLQDLLVIMAEQVQKVLKETKDL
jgi:hypothetical protein